ncbi:hypothetical protein BGM26_14025 [Bacillus sp. FJAT-29790]|uniref:hypothetical protein n=1 Tax=Bacillus sp. FJAT-29790 TaxID=1895002 RepID=UPI001C228730|nr:hypothetical protein [Bacillus sp. FJAT-29790]MBU8880096.1 hypothetical protein [Bacillus sp. FJAT-29790]
MDDLKISFRFGNTGFHEISELTEGNQEKVKQFFLLWEKRVRHCSAVHSLNRCLNLDSRKFVHISVETKKESPTVNG